MGEDVAAAGFIDVEADHLLADRALGGDRVKPPPAQELDAQELDELHDPYRDVPHVPPPKAQTKKIPASERNYDGAFVPAQHSAGCRSFGISETPDQLTHGAPAPIVVKPT
jgi:hypothetical protein